MSKKLPFFKFDTDSWLTGKIQLLSATEKGIFIDLIARIWHENGTIKNDGILHRLLRVEKATLSDALQAFFDLGIMTEKDGYLNIKFIDEQINAHKEFSKKQSEYGAKGGRPKKGTKANKKEEIRKKNEDSRIEKEEYNIPPTPPLPETYKSNLSELTSRINKLFNRTESTLWNGLEITELQIVAKRPGVLDELSAIERLYNSGYEFRRKTIKNLLENWTFELDLANNIKQPPKREKGF